MLINIIYYYRFKDSVDGHSDGFNKSKGFNNKRKDDNYNNKR